MKLQIDTAAKTIKIEHIVNLGELLTALANMFPDGAWREYSIEPTVIQNWNNPIIINPAPAQPFNQPFTPYPWQNPITYGGSTTDILPFQKDLTTVFNVDYNTIP